MRTYELVVIFRPELDEEGLDGLVSTFREVIVGSGGEPVTLEHMGRRRLAYPIQKLTEGHYVLMYANLDQTSMSELERRLKLSDDVLRYLLIRMEDEAAAELQAQVASAQEAPQAEEVVEEPEVAPAEASEESAEE